MPGATTSGLIRPSSVGPRLEKAATCSALPALGSLFSGSAGNSKGQFSHQVKMSFWPPWAAQTALLVASQG